MTKGSLAVLAAAMLLSTAASMPANAQSRAYDEGYRDGYRAGYDDARNGQQYDDRARSDDNDRPDGDSRQYGGPSTDRSDLWRQRYTHTYTYQDDGYYRECRNRPDPGGVIAGALIGGLLGNAVGRGGGRAGATVAGVIVGGAAGAALTNHVECGDRSYIYRTYYDGFNAGRTHQSYRWRNPQSGNYGEVRVDSYYTDPDGFRCVNFAQSFHIDGDKRERQGSACQQPDGTWAVVG